MVTQTCHVIPLKWIFPTAHSALHNIKKIVCSARHRLGQSCPPHKCLNTGIHVVKHQLLVTQCHTFSCNPLPIKVFLSNLIRNLLDMFIGIYSLPSWLKRVLNYPHFNGSLWLLNLLPNQAWAVKLEVQAWLGRRFKNHWLSEGG